MALIPGSRGLVTCLAVLVLVFLQLSGSSAIGVNYGTLANNLPTPQQVVALLKTTYISQVKIYDTNPEVIAAFANSGIALTVGARNDEIASLAASPSFAQLWVSQNVAAYYPATDIIGIVVGNEVLTTATNSSNDLLPAMQNLYTGLSNLGLSKIKVTTPHSYAVLDTSYPPSDGIFRTDLAGPIFSPLLNFLAQTGSPFMINIYPYFAYRDDPKISISYALFGSNAVVVDSVTGFSYNNLFDAQVDAAYAAIAKLGHNDITVVVSETGWPSFGDANEVGVGMTNAQTYISNLLNHVNSNVGTPAKPGVAIDTLIFALFNENQKPGPGSERNFGLFLPDESVVYDVGLVIKNSSTSSPPPPPVVTTPSSPPPPVVSTPASPPPPLGSVAPTPTSTPPASPPPPFASASPPPPSTATPPPPFTAPPPPYPVPHIPPAAGSTPSPPPPVATTPPASAPSPATSPPPALSSPSPPVTAPPPPSFFTPPPGAASPAGTPPYLPSPPPPPATASSPPPPVTVTPSPVSPPPPAAASSPPPPVTVTPSPVSPPPPSVPVTPGTGSPPPPAPAVPSSPPPPAPPAPTPATGAPPGTPPAPPGTASGPNTWCVAKPGSASADLANALNYACGEGGADCSQIQTGGTCFDPNTLFSHASYAFSSYYALNGRNYWNCFFGNSSLISITNPSYAGCVYP